MLKSNFIVEKVAFQYFLNIAYIPASGVAGVYGATVIAYRQAIRLLDGPLSHKKLEICLKVSLIMMII